MVGEEVVVEVVVVVEVGSRFHMVLNNRGLEYLSSRAPVTDLIATIVCVLF